QSSAAMQAIARHLPSLKELSINCQSLEPAEVEVFQACPQLEKLKMGGKEQSSATVQAILSHLPSLKELIIEIDTPDFALADALRNSPNLWSLDLSVHKYAQGFLEQYLQNPCPKLSLLSIYNSDKYSLGSKEDAEAVKDAEKKGMAIDLIYIYLHWV
ncbi:hypothetical protein NECID01_2176, partial [Nematocida sp. AWRm77]